MANNIMEYIQYINNLPICDATTREILNGYIVQLDEIINSEHIHDIYMTKEMMEGLYITKEYIDSIDFNQKLDLSSYVTKEELESKKYLTESSETNLATIAYTDKKIIELKQYIDEELKKYALKSELDTIYDFLRELELRIKSIEDDNKNIIKDLEDLKNVVTMHAIRYEISKNIINTNTITTIEDKKTYSTVLTCDIGYELDTVQVLMNGVDITNQCVSKTNTKAMIDVVSVTGPLTIKASTATMYSITYQTTDGVILSNEQTSIKAGERYTLIIDYVSGYKNDLIMVTMGGVDISSSSIVSPGPNQNGVSIPSVTGNVVITVMAIIDVTYNEYTITYNLSNCISANEETKIRSGESYYTRITLDENYEVDSITVTMGGININNMCLMQLDYNVYEIDISEVTGNLVITVDTSYYAYCTSLTCWDEVWIEEGSDAPLGVDVQPSNCTESLYWDVSDLSALSVYETTGATNPGSGSIYAHAVKAGTYTVTFHCGTKTAKCTVVIGAKEILCEGITVRDVTVQAKSSTPAQYITTPIDCNEDLYVESLTIANTSIAQKEGTINVKGVSEGSTTGTLTVRGGTSGNTFSDTFNITVTSIHCTSITFDRNSISTSYNPDVSINLNQYLILTPSNTTDPVTWYTDNNNIPVSDGYVRLSARGSAKIQARCNNMAATIDLIIN